MQGIPRTWQRHGESLPHRCVKLSQMGAVVLPLTPHGCLWARSREVCLGAYRPVFGRFRPCLPSRQAAGSSKRRKCTPWRRRLPRHSGVKAFPGAFRAGTSSATCPVRWGGSTLRWGTSHFTNAACSLPSWRMPPVIGASARLGELSVEAGLLLRQRTKRTSLPRHPTNPTMSTRSPKARVRGLQGRLQLEGGAAIVVEARRRPEGLSRENHGGNCRANSGQLHAILMKTPTRDGSAKQS
jgi:hypothetical protein